MSLIRRTERQEQPAADPRHVSTKGQRLSVTGFPVVLGIAERFWHLSGPEAGHDDRPRQWQPAARRSGPAPSPCPFPGHLQRYSISQRATHPSQNTAITAPVVTKALPLRCSRSAPVHGVDRIGTKDQGSEVIQSS